MTGSPNLLEIRESTKPALGRLKIAFWLDAALLFSACAVQAVSFTGLVLHEWIGLVIAGMVLVHLLLAWSWIAAQSRRLFAERSARARVNYLLNLSLFAAVTAAILSGVLISQKAVPMITGKEAAIEMDWRWDTLHRQFSNFVIILAGFHLAMNWDWVVAAGRKIFQRVREGTV